jgi:succinate dehydrogenase / fumarate reductase iron-sulfur subunit
LSIKEKFVIAKIQRFDPSTDEAPRLQEYRIPIEEQIDVQDLLREIYEKEDPTLAFRNYDCYRGVCSGCLISVNGKNCRACSTWINPGDELTIDPAKGFPVIKDLVVDFTNSKQ